MINFILKKIIRFIRIDRPMQLKLGGIILLVVLTSVLGNILKEQNQALAEVRAQKVLVAQIPEMEKQLKEIKSKAQRKTDDLKSLSPENQIAEIKRILEGTSYRLGVYQAIINGEVYSTGDEIGDYTITEITMEAIILKNNDSNEIEKLYFPEFYQGREYYQDQTGQRTED